MEDKKKSIAKKMSTETLPPLRFKKSRWYWADSVDAIRRNRHHERQDKYFRKLNKTENV